MKYAYFIALLIVGITVLYFLQGTTMKTYDLYYYSETTDKELNNGEIACDTRAVIAVERKTSDDISLEQVIKNLIKGELTADEKVAGISTEFPNPSFDLLDAETNNGNAKLTFSDVPGFTTGGSCRIGLLRAQIEKTALGYPGIKAVEILPAEILQP